MESAGGVDTGLSNPLVRPTLLFGWALLVAAALVGGMLPPITREAAPLWVAVLAIGIDFALITAQRPGRLDRPRLALVIGVSLVAVLFLLVQGAGTGPMVLYVLGYLNVAVSLLIMRGHPLVGVCLASLILLSIAWRGVLVGASPREQLERLALPIVTVGVFALIYAFARSLERKRSRAVDEQLLAVTRADAARSRSTQSDRVRSQIVGIARPLLEQLAAGTPLTPQFHQAVVDANEAIRNRIRRDLPAHPEFLTAIDAVRERGVAIQLIGSEDASSRRMDDALVDRLVALLHTEGVTAATVRFLPLSRGGSCSVLLEAPTGTLSYELEPAGVPRPEPA